MKRVIYTVLIGFFVFVNSINAQEDKTTVNEEDAFTYERINVIDQENGTLSLLGSNDTKQNSIKESNEAENKNSSSGIGETSGNLSVSLTGGANYNIPIAVPPGIDGIAPEISLAYNSQAGNGLAGFGWNLNGISVISRIPASKFHDGQIDGVDFDNLDRFALDGERLILKSGTYGGNGATYETENFSNLKITSYCNSCNDGPAYFKIYYPDGSYAFYGLNNNSKSHLNYAISSWTNPQGIKISYEYIINYNSQYINKIKYGSKHPNTPINEIQFNYDTRKRWEQSYINGVSVVRKDLLKNIESYSNGIRYRKYLLSNSSNTYPTNTQTNLRYNRLNGVTEQSGDGSKNHSSIVFSYDTSNYSSINFDGVTTDLGLTNIEQRNSQVVSLDMTGNGNMDFIVYPNTKNKFWMFHDIQSGGSNNPYEINSGNFESIFPSTLLNSQNKILSGQGFTIVQKDTGSQVKFKVHSKASVTSGLPINYDYTKTWNSPSYTYQNSPTSSTQKQISKEYVSGDFNGDGLTDVLAIGKPYTNRYCYEHECKTSENGDSFEDLHKISQQKDESYEDFELREKEYKKEFKENLMSKPPPLDPNDPFNPGGGNNPCYSCNTYNVNYNEVYFINLRRDITSNFSNYAGGLQLQLTGDYKLQTGDFNGDGKTDLLQITNGKMYIYSLDNNNTLSLLWQVTDSGITTTAPPILGDYNGDGKTDFLDPIANNSYSFRMFISTGISFVKETRVMPFKYVKTNWDGNNGVLSGYNLVPLDANGDGKTDIVEYNTTTYNNNTNGTQTIKVYNNHGLTNTASPTQIGFVYGGTATKTGNLKHFPIPIFLTSNQPNKSLDFASISNKWVTNFSFTMDHREDVLLRSVTNNDVRYTIEYSSLDPSIYHNDYFTKVYESEYSQVYPNVDLQIAPSTKVVTSLNRSGSANPAILHTKKIYAYKGAVFNAEGLGFLGYQAIARSNWHTDNSDRIFSVSKYDPSLRGAMIAEYSMAHTFSFTTPTSSYISKTNYQYGSSLSSDKVFKLWLETSLNQNNLDGTYTNTGYQYDQYNNPLNISASFFGGTRIQNITYSNSVGSNYHIGRPTNTTTSTTIGSEAFNTEQQFVYSGYLLFQKKMKGNGTPFDIESYEYDTFGNTKKITSTPNGESPREIEFVYDPSGRFITKSIDIEDLETNYLYNTTHGNLTKVINPFGQETTFEYDEWNRQVKTIDYLGKETTTNFEENNDHEYTVTTASDDGSGMIVEYDVEKRISVIKEKNLFGEWISKKYEYDALDRIIKQSEPYTGDNPSQWNETTYDLYSRPLTQTLYTGRIININYNGLTTTVDDGVKTVTSTRNQFGNTTSVTDPGGTINYTYYGNGNLKTANNSGVIVSTEQDGWGRKTKLTDPSAGVYEYEYNGFGEITNETNPKGETDYVYSPLGVLLQKNIIGDNTDMSIQYTYNPTHKLIDAISVINSDGNNSTYSYGYDSDIRLTDISESNPHAQFTQQYTYDDFGRVNTEEYYGKLLSNNKSSTKKIKNEYQNGMLKTIKDFSTNNNIWDATSVNARGQLTAAAIGNNLIDSKSYDSYGYLSNNSIEKTGANSEVLMQLITDFNEQRGTLNNRSNSMFSWSETFEYDDLDRLIDFNDNDGDNSLAYDPLGRITSNNTVGNYNYSGTSYQVNNIDLNDQGDLYYQQNRLEQIKYNAFKKPFEISEDGKEKIGFQYNAFMGRSHMFYGDTEDNILDRNNRKHYSFDGSMEISYDEDADTSLFVTYIGGDAYSAPAIWRSKQETNTTDNNYYYLHRDYLGSILLITDGDGNAQEKRHFDAWGKIVKVTDGNNNYLDKLTFLDRGYTGHEHLQGVNLIHMNGRLYDPNLKRFLSPDNYIQDITNTQNFNRYGYVLNNPLMYVDPSGETSMGPGGGPEDDYYQPNYNYQNSLNGARSVDVDIDFRGFRNWIGRNAQSVVKDIGGVFNSIKSLFGGGKKAAPIEYSNYDNLSNDPLAGSSAPTQNASFGGGGTENSGLGIAFDAFGSGFNSGFSKFWGNIGDAVSSPIDTYTGYMSETGWKNFIPGYVVYGVWAGNVGNMKAGYSIISEASNGNYYQSGQIAGYQTGQASLDLGLMAVTYGTVKGTSMAVNSFTNTTTTITRSVGAAPRGFSNFKIPKGFKPVKDFGYQHGQKVYSYKGKYYSRDVDMHSGGVWKVFNNVNGRLTRIGTADAFLNIFAK